MQETEYSNIITLLKHLCTTLQPFADSRNTKLDFTTTEKEIKIDYPERELLHGFSKLVSTIIDYMPDNNSIYINAEIIEKNTAKYVSIKIQNTGINLRLLTALVNKSILPVTLYSFATNETTFEVCYCLSSDTVKDITKQDSLNGTLWNYINVVNGIKSHFSKLNNPVARLAETKPKEAAFLMSINNCILKNIDNEQFDANALSIAMAISRAQLLRRLKSLTGNAPGYYIKTMRLEKAKELLETPDVSVSEAAFQTGFNSPSNFTKVFTEKYGITPSQFRRTRQNATNE